MKMIVAVAVNEIWNKYEEYFFQIYSYIRRNNRKMYIIHIKNKATFE